jgi:integrase
LSQRITTAINKKPTFESSNVFLSSVLRNSYKTKLSYQSALNHFQRFLQEKYPPYNIESILIPFTRNEIDIYVVFEQFISYILTDCAHLSPKSIKLYVMGVRSYLAYHDIEIMPSKFRRKVRMPKLYREDEQPIDAEDIRKILLSCNNRRLKSYLLVLASGAMRAGELLATRVRDYDFSVSPTKVHIRKEYSKTGVARDIYISDEATNYLKQWLDWKYNNEERPRKPNPDDLVFAMRHNTNPYGIYPKIIDEFQKLLAIVGLDERKEGSKRRKITLHSLRRHCKGIISNQVNQDYSEWFLGHSRSPYYTLKEAERRTIYSTKVIKYLTFLDYTTLQATGKNIEAKLQEKDIEIQNLRQKYTQDIENMKEQMLTIEKSQVETRNLLHELRLRNMKLSFSPYAA